jgi:hypothetical protein
MECTFADLTSGRFRYLSRNQGIHDALTTSVSDVSDAAAAAIRYKATTDADTMVFNLITMAALATYEAVMAAIVTRGRHCSVQTAAVFLNSMSPGKG